MNDSLADRVIILAAGVNYPAFSFAIKMIEDGYEIHLYVVPATNILQLRQSGEQKYLCH